MFDHRARPGTTVHVSREELAKLIVVTVADIAEQLTGVSAFIDVYQPDQPTKLWPGNGKPGLGLAWFSEMLQLAAPHLQNAPPIFNDCTTILRDEDESYARDCYWDVVQREESLAPDEQQHRLREAICANPFIAEPHVLLAQLLLMDGCWEEAAHHSATALEILYCWGTCWDKRMGWAQWIGFTRMLHLQASRGANHQPKLPWKQLGDNDEVQLVFLQDLVDGFDDVSEK